MNFDWTLLHWIQNTLVCPAMDFLMPKITLLGNGDAVWILAAGVLLEIPGRTRICVLSGLLTCTEQVLAAKLMQIIQQYSDK